MQVNISRRAAKSVLADLATTSGTAENLTNARTINFTGAVEGSGTFDGIGNITINLTVSEESLMSDETSDDEWTLCFGLK